MMTGPRGPLPIASRRRARSARVSAAASGGAGPRAAARARSREAGRADPQHRSVERPCRFDDPIQVGIVHAIADERARAAADRVDHSVTPLAAGANRGGRPRDAAAVAGRRAIRGGRRRAAADAPVPVTRSMPCSTVRPIAGNAGATIATRAREASIAALISSPTWPRSVESIFLNSSAGPCDAAAKRTASRTRSAASALDRERESVLTAITSAAAPAQAATSPLPDKPCVTNVAHASAAPVRSSATITATCTHGFCEYFFRSSSWRCFRKASYSFFSSGSRGEP